MIGFLNWFLGDVCLPVAAVAAIGLLVDVVRMRGRVLVELIQSTLFMRHVHAYNKARSRTPGGSTNSPGASAPQRAPGATGPGVEARSVEEPSPPPVPPQTSVGAGDLPPQRPAPTGLPQSPVGGGHTPATPPTGPRTRHV